MNTATIEEVKNQIKTKTILPFTVRDITNQGNDLYINNRYKFDSTRKTMNTLGIKESLTKEIFSETDDVTNLNWAEVRSAINKVDKNRLFNCIVNENSEVEIFTGTSFVEPTQLNFDNRIDSAMNAINDSNDTLTEIFYLPETGKLVINSTKEKEISCGPNDSYKAGTSTNLGLTSNTFKSFYLRLACANGLMVQEVLFNRVFKSDEDVERQYNKFSKQDSSDMIVIKVNKLKNSRASFAELSDIAKVLSSDERDLYIPEYTSTVNDLELAGYPIKDMNASKARYTYTNENLYDMFNRATYLATHKKDEIGLYKSNALNMAASKIFSKGPHLQFKLLDIYNN